MSLAGSLGAVILAFLLPPMCFIKLSQDSWFVWRNEGRVWQSAWELYSAAFLILFGTIASVGSVYQTIVG